MCWGQRLAPVVVPSAAHETVMDIDVRGLGQALGPRLEEAGRQHPRALIKTNTWHKVGSQTNDHLIMRRTVVTVGTSSYTWARSGSV
jgi:hypothetical protein